MTPEHFKLLISKLRNFAESTVGHRLNQDQLEELQDAMQYVNIKMKELRNK